MSRLAVWPACVVFALTGCGDDPAETASTPVEKVDRAPQIPGKADSDLQPIFAGRLAAGGALEGTLAGKDVPAVRVLSHGGTVLDLRLEALSDDLDPFLIIEGPLTDDGADPPLVAYNDDASADTFSAGLAVKLEAPGAYRVLVGSYGGFVLGAAAEGAWRLKVDCLEGCAMPQMTLREVVADLQADLGEAAAEGLLAEGVERWFGELETADDLKAQVSALTQGEGDGPLVFPVVPLSSGAVVQGLLERREITPAPPAGAQIFELADLKAADCAVDRPTLAPVSDLTPKLLRGAVADGTWAPCALQRARAFAEVLNNLALENGSKVMDGDTDYTSVSEVFDGLLASGHRIEAENNRYIANFLGLYYRKDEVVHAVVAPVWLQTGATWPGLGEEIAIPAPHSHYTFRVSGPLVEATIEFYMGTNGGTRFRAADTVDPQWVGERTLYRYDSDTDPQTVRTLLQVAGALRKKWTTAAAELPAGGYGQLGVCNDSTAILEYATEGTATIFPLAHPEVEVPMDTIDGWLQSLPRDFTEAPAEGVLSRIALSWAFEPGASNPFPELSARLAALATR